MSRWLPRAAWFRLPSVALVLPAEGALGVAGLGGVPGGGDGLGVLFGLTEIDGDDQVPVLRGGGPHLVLLHPVHPDVVGGPAQVVVVIGGGLFVLLIPAVKFPRHLGGPGHHAVHHFRVQLVPGVPGVRVQQALPRGPVADPLQGLRRVGELLLHRLGGKLPGPQQGQHPVGAVREVLLLQQALLQAVVQKPADLQTQIDVLHAAASSSLLCLIVLQIFPRHKRARENPRKNRDARANARANFFRGTRREPSAGAGGPGR